MKLAGSIALAVLLAIGAQGETKTHKIVRKVVNHVKAAVTIGPVTLGTDASLFAFTPSQPQTLTFASIVASSKTSGSARNSKGAK